MHNDDRRDKSQHVRNEHREKIRLYVSVSLCRCRSRFGLEPTLYVICVVVPQCQGDEDAWQHALSERVSRRVRDGLGRHLHVAEAEHGESCGPV